MDPGQLVGRGAELAVLAEVMDAVQAGRLGVVLVEGEAGIGKTTLVRAALAEATARVVWATGDEAETGLDHGVVDQLVRNAPLDARSRAGLFDEIGGDPLRTGAALVRLLDGIDLDRDRPLAVVVDDAQWADGASLQALAFAARRLRRDPVVLCLVVRTEGLDDLPANVLRLVDDAGRRLVVGPLDRAAVRLLAENQSGEVVTAPVADRLVEHTRGNPLHLVSLLEEMRPSALASVDELPSPQPFASLVRSKLASMTQGAQDVVAAVAVVGDPIPVAVAGIVADVDGLAAAVDEAVAQGLVALDGGHGAGASARSMSMAHPLVRAAVLSDLSLERRAELHRRAGGALGGAVGLRHRLLGSVGGDRDLWSEAVEEARRQDARGAHGTAAGLLALAVGVATEQVEREATVQAALDEHLMAGQVREAEALRPAVHACEPSAGRSYSLGRAAYVIGPRREAPPLLADAWRRLTGGDDPCVPDDLGPTVREAAGRVAAMLATVGVDRARGEEAIRWARLAVELSPEQAALASAAHMLASGHALRGTFEDGVLELDGLCDRLRRTLGAADPTAVDCHSARGLLRLWSHELDGAAADFEASLAASGERGAFVAQETARFYLAETRYRQGRWDEAILLAELSASLVDDSGQDWVAALPHATAARPLGARGESADEHLERSAAAAATVGAGVGIVLAQVAALEVAACRRDHPVVVALGAALVGDAGRHVDERIAPWRASFVEALVAEGRLAEANELVVELAAAPSTPLVATDAARAAVVLAAAGGDDAEVDRAAGVGLALDPAAVGPYPRARLELAVGRAWRRRGERRRAMGVLEPALDRFRGLGARPWVEQVEREMAASGLRPARAPARAGTDLTPQEQAVAHLVARGLTNREAAAELVVSAKTVEHHLSRIYAKLGVRSRTELVRRLDAGG